MLTLLRMQIRTKDAVDHFGGVPELANKLDIKPQAIYQWGEFVPETRAYQIHVLSDRALPKPELPEEQTAGQGRLFHEAG